MQNFLKNKKILVLGGSGFVGKHVISNLVKKKSRIVVLTRNYNKVKTLKVLGPPGQIEIISGNIFEDGLLETLIKDKFAVINLCGILYETRNNEFDIIHNFLPNLISKICKKFKINNLIHLSALGVSKESDSKYSKSKALGEEKILKNFKNAKILRPSIIYGIGDNFFGLFEKISKISPVIPIIGPNIKFQPVYISDVALVIEKLLEAKKLNDNIFNICGPEQFTFYDLIKNFMENLNRRRIFLKLNPKLMMLPGLILQNFPNPPFTFDQMKLLKFDNISDGLFPELNDLNVKPTHLYSKLQEISKFYN